MENISPINVLQLLMNEYSINTYKSPINSELVSTLYSCLNTTGISGYIKERPQAFQNPIELCFNSDKINCNICEEFTFIKCSCKANFCFDHFYIKYHFFYYIQYIT